MSARPELTALRKDGTEFPVDISLGPFEADEGKLILSAIRDVSERKRYERMLTVANAELQERTQAYEREHRIAQRLQEALLFEDLPRMERLKFDAIYNSAEEVARVGGDWYGVQALSDGRVFFSVGDVAGSGLQAAVLMVRTRETMLASSVHTPDPASVLLETNEVLRMRGSDTMVTALCGFIEPLTGMVHFASAGHPPPLLLNAGDATYLKGRGAPLGILEDPRCVTTSLHVEAGSALVLYTDGILEYDRDILAAEQRLRDVARVVVMEGAEHPASTIFERVLRKAKPRDDVVVFVMTFAPAAAPLPTDVDSALMAP